MGKNPGLGFCLQFCDAVGLVGGHSACKKKLLQNPLGWWIMRCRSRIRGFSNPRVQP